MNHRRMKARLLCSTLLGISPTALLRTMRPRSLRLEGFSVSVAPGSPLPSKGTERAALIRINNAPGAIIKDVGFKAEGAYTAVKSDQHVQGMTIEECVAEGGPVTLLKAPSVAGLKARKNRVNPPNR